MNAHERNDLRKVDVRRSHQRADALARHEAFRAWVGRQGADPITTRDAMTRLRVAASRAGKVLMDLVAAGVLVKLGPGEYRLKGRTL